MNERKRSEPTSASAPGSGADDLQRMFAKTGRSLEETLPSGCLCCAAGMACDAHSLADMVRTPPVELPMVGALERLFGASLSTVRAHLGEASLLEQLGAAGAADGDVVAFADAAPSVGTLVHEVVHVLQARSSGATGGAVDTEAEARRIAKQVELGLVPDPIEGHATGIQLEEEPRLTAWEYVEKWIEIAFDGIRNLFAAYPLTRSAPFGTYISQKDELGFAVVDSLERKGYVLNSIISPESMEKIVDAARRRFDEEQTGPDGKKIRVLTDVGPAYLSLGVIRELENAFVRRFFESMERMIPRYVAEAWRLDPRPINNVVLNLPFGMVKPSADALPVSHPLDRAVARALCKPDIWVFDRSFKYDHPELVPTARAQSRTVELRFNPRGLWHWVEAKPDDATAEEVARALFGNEEQAYRLIPMAPLWGFHARDILYFTDAMRDSLDAEAWHNHATPAVLNAKDIAYFEANQQAHWQEYASFEHGMPDPEKYPWVNDKAPLPHYGLPRDELDPMTELQGMEGQEQLALAHAKQQTKDTKLHDQLETYDLLDSNLSLLVKIESSLAALKLTTNVTTERATTMLLRKQRAGACTLPDPAAAHALAERQGKVLGRIAIGLGSLVVQMIGFGGLSLQDDGKLAADPTNLPDMVKTPLFECVDAFVEGVTAIDFPDVADTRVKLGERLLKLLPITVAEAGLHAGEPTLTAAMQTPEDRRKDTADYDPGEMEGNLNSYLEQFSEIRIKLMSNDPMAQAQLAELQPRVADLQFEISIVSQLEMLDGLWKAINDEHDFWEGVPDAYKGLKLQDKNRGFYAQFRDEVYNPYKAAVAETDEKKKTEGKEAAKRRYAELTGPTTEFTLHFKAVIDHLEGVHRHKKWAKIVVAVAIAVVAFALGQWAGAAYLVAGEGATLFGSLVVGTVVEQGVSISLNYLVLDQKPTAGSLITGAVTSFWMLRQFSNIGRLAKTAGAAAEVEKATAVIAEQGIADLAKMGKVERLLAAGKKFGYEALVMQAMGLVQAEAQNLIDNHALISPDELPEMLVQNLIMTIGMHIARRPVEESITRWKNKKLGLDFDGLTREREAISKLGKQLQEAPDPEKAQQLMEREGAYRIRERELMEKLADLATRKPGMFPEGEADRLNAALAAYDRASAELAKAHAVMSLEEIGPGLYRADRRAMDTIIGEQQAADGHVVAVETDPISGVRKITIQPREGAPITIKEKLTSPANERAVSIEESRKLEAWLADDAKQAHPDPETSALYKSRLRELYARDPIAAVNEAERIGYDTEHAKAAQDPLGDPQRAFEHYEFQRAGDPKESRIGDHELTHADFEAMYRGGYEYDPITRSWRPRPGAMRAGGTTAIPTSGVGGVTHFVGVLHSEAVGTEVMRMLAAGEPNALRLAGVEPPAGFDPRTTEWGLGRRSDGSIVLVRGGAGEVNWSALPDVEPLAHSHPFRDPITGLERRLVGTQGKRSLAADLSDATHEDLVWLTPSTSDVAEVVRTGKPHSVHTPYVLDGEGRIANPDLTASHDTIDFVITSAELAGTLAEGSPITVYKATVHVMAGDRVIWTGEIYQAVHPELGDLPSTKAPDTLAPMQSLPEVPVSTFDPTATSAGRAGRSSGTGQTPAPPTVDVLRLRQNMAATLKIKLDNVSMAENAALPHISVRPPTKPGGTYEVHYPPGTPEQAIRTAIERHVELARLRPADVKNKPTYLDDRGNTRTWTGRQEAEYQGRPAADKGDYWALFEGKLRYVRGDTETAGKRIYDEKLGILVPDTGARTEPTFAKGTTRAEAFELLGGNDPNTEFGAWVSAAERVLGKTKAELTAELGDPSKGLTFRTIRHGLKEGRTKKMVAKICDSSFLEAKYGDLYKGVTNKEKIKQIASHRELLKLTEGLGSGDRGSMAEQWYVQIWGAKNANGEPMAKRHPEFSKSEMAKLGIKFHQDSPEKRIPDLIDGQKLNRLKDIKHVTGKLGADDVIQLADFAMLLTKPITIGGVTYTFESFTVVFTVPAGARANAAYIAEILGPNNVNAKSMAFEIFNSHGERKVITTEHLARSDFNISGGADGLISAIQSWAK